MHCVCVWGGSCYFPASQSTISGEGGEQRVTRWLDSLTLGTLCLQFLPNNFKQKTAATVRSGAWSRAESDPPLLRGWHCDFRPPGGHDTAVPELASSTLTPCSRGVRRASPCLSPSLYARAGTCDASPTTPARPGLGLPGPRRLIGGTSPPEPVRTAVKRAPSCRRDVRGSAGTGLAGWMGQAWPPQSIPPTAGAHGAQGAALCKQTAGWL